MPRRSGGGGMRRAPARGFSSGPARRPAPTKLPARPPPAAVAPPAAGQVKQPGMFAQMAATATGVAVGSAVGHTIAGGLLGGGSGEQNVEAAPQDQQPMEAAPEAGSNPCQMELRQFIQCAQTQSDFTLCRGFNEALRECRITYGMPLE